MRETRVIDAHVHFWDPGVLHYPWLTSTPDLSRAFLPADLESLASHAVDEMVFVEANCKSAESVRELDFVDGLAECEPRIAGAVAFVDLCAEASARDRALEELKIRPRVVGVRHNIQGNPRGFALQPEFVDGVRAVGANDLVFDLCVTADQLLDATELVRRCPDTTFVLDHCGKPSIRADAFEPWATDLRRLAEFENVSCKLSGLASEARPEQRSHEGLFRYARHAMDCFGAARMMYGSDWPVVTTAGGEPAWRALVEAFTADWTTAGRQAFFSGNAIRLYGLRENAKR